MAGWMLPAQAAEDQSALFGGSRWIGVATSRSEAGKRQDEWGCFRTTFFLPQKPAQAPARISVDSKYWLWVNGNPVVFEGGLKRGPTPNDSYFDEINLAPWLRSGKNTIAILTWYWGRTGFSHQDSGSPGLLFTLTANGRTISSGPSWKARLHPAYGRAEGESPNFRLSESNIRFDKRVDDAGWQGFVYDDRNWPEAADLGSPGAAPWNRLFARPIPLWKDYGLKDYANAASLPSLSDGRPIVARLPYNAQITPWLSVESPEGQTIRIQTGNYRGGGDPNVRAEYVTAEGRQEYESLGWMNGHEVIYEIPAGVKIIGLKYRETGYDTTFSGSFHSDDSFADTLWEKARRTLYVNMRDTYMDCPDRERAQWWGDVVIDLGAAPYALGPSASLLTRKAVRELADWQREDKVMYSPIPGNWGKELAQQGLASVGYYGFWTYYLTTGDQTTMIEVYPRVREYLALWTQDAEGLVNHRSGNWDWSDWGENADGRMLDQAWYCLALQGAAGMARLTGREDEAQTFERKREIIIEAANRICWTGEAYRFPGYNGATDDRANALSVISGIAGPDRFPAIKKVLATEFHASPYMEKYVLEALLRMNDPDASLKRMKKRYGEIAADKWTTLPELWITSANAAQVSHSTSNHAWSGGPLTLLSQYFAGLAPVKPGWDEFQVRPLMGPLRQIEAAVDTRHGFVKASMRREENSFSLDLSVPKTTQALVSLPMDGGAPEKVTLNGKVAWEKGAATSIPPGATFEGERHGRLNFRLPPGEWKILMSIQKTATGSGPGTASSDSANPAMGSTSRLGCPFAG